MKASIFDQNFIRRESMVRINQKNYVLSTKKVEIESDPWIEYSCENSTARLFVCVEQGRDNKYSYVAREERINSELSLNLLLNLVIFNSPSFITEQKLLQKYNQFCKPYINSAGANPFDQVVVESKDLTSDAKVINEVYIINEDEESEVLGITN